MKSVQYMRNVRNKSHDARQLDYWSSEGKINQTESDEQKNTQPINTFVV